MDCRAGDFNGRLLFCAAGVKAQQWHQAPFSARCFDVINSMEFDMVPDHSSLLTSLLSCWRMIVTALLHEMTLISPGTILLLHLYN